MDGDWFVGRQAELERVLDRARRVPAGLQTVLVGGPPGLGKTALLHRVAAELNGFTVLWAVGDSWESEVPYGLVSQLVSPTRPQYQADYPLLFGLGAPDASPHRVGAELIDLIGQLDARRPVAMIIDDLPAADPLSLRALAFALRRMREARALLLVAARPSLLDAEPADWRTMLPVELTEVQVGEFGRDEVMWLARGHGIPWLPPARLDWLSRYTGGHPLYLHQLLTHVDHDRLLADVGSAIPPPRPVVTAIGRQVRALPPAGARLLEALAVLDGRYPLAVVAELAGLVDLGEQPDEAMAPLVTENLVRTWPQLPSTPIRVRYPIQRDAVYQTIAPSRRRKLHTAALGWSHGRAAWVHKVAASDRMDVHLAADLEAAAQGVLREGRPARAATFLLWAADLSGFPPDRERRILQAAAHLLWSYRFSRAEALFAEVENAADSPLRSCILGRYSMMRGWYSAAETAFHRALASAGTDGWVRMLATTGLASLYCWLGRGGEAAANARQALEQAPARTDQHPELARLARQYLAAAELHTTGAVAAVAEIDRQLRLPERAGLASGADADGLAWRSLLRGLAGQPAAAVDDADAVQRLMESAAVAEVEVGPQYCLAWAQYLLGQWEDAAANASHAITLAVAGGRSWAYAYTHMVSAVVAAGRGEWDLAETAATETRRWVRALGPPQYVVFSAMATAAVAQARGDQHSVLRALRPLTSLVEVSGWVLAYEPWWRVMAAEALIAQGALAGAQTTVDRLAGLAVTMPALGPVVAWLAGSLHAARGEDEAALRLFAEAADVPDALPLYAALLDEAHGRLLVRVRQWRAGLTRLQRAHRGFTAVGAVPFAERCAGLLSASGVRPSQHNAGPLLALTERERAIAELVARGLTNQEVAERLFISSKTVSHHLGRIFAKLGVASRRELRDLVGAGGPGPPGPPRLPKPPPGPAPGRTIAGPRPPTDR